MEVFIISFLSSAALVFIIVAIRMSRKEYMKNKSARKKFYEEKISYAKDRFLNNPITGNYTKGLNK